MAFLFPSTVIHVSPNGAIGGDGSEAKPLNTLPAARDRVRFLFSLGAENIEVILHDGEYPLKETFAFGPEDSGKGRWVRYRAANKGKAVVTGGLRVSPVDFKPVEDPSELARLHPLAVGKIRYLDLTPLGCQHTGPAPVSYKEDDDGLLKLVVEGLELPPSRWPKKGFAHMVEVRDMGLEKGHLGRFVYDDPTPERWDLSRGVWLSGWWRVEFARDTVRVAKIDDETKEITLAGTVPNGIGSKFHRPDKSTGKVGSGKEPYFAVNLLEETSRPGEWCLDHKTRRLYLYPPEGFESNRIEISDMKGPLVQINGASNLSFEGIVFTTALGDGLELNRASAIRIAGCEIRSVKSGVRAFEPFHVETISCDIHDVREIGVQYDYHEDRKNVENFRGERSENLIPGGDQIRNNHIWNAATGITMGSVGFPVDGLVSHNLVHDIRGMGMRYGGNGLRIEKNEFHNLLLRSGDGGAIYSARRVTSRGNVVCHNLIHHVPGVNAIYIDDGECGTTAFGNVIVGSDVGLWVSGGRENVLVSNLIVQPKTAALHMDDRGVSRAYGDPESIDGRYMWVFCLGSINLSTGPWATRYPEMAEALGGNRGYPVKNVTGDNLILELGHAAEFRRKYNETSFIDCQFRPNRLEFSAEDLPGLANLDFTPRWGSPLVDNEIFLKIPFKQIGLVVDEFRLSLPTPDPRRFESRRKFGQDDVSEKDMEESNKRK